MKRPTRGIEPNVAFLRIIEKDLAVRKEVKVYCNYCGKVIPDDAHVCAYCGKRVAGVVARQRLVRPRKGRKIAGVCLGFAEYFDLDVTLVRIVWAVFSIFGLTGVIGYVAAWIIMPEEPYLLNEAPGALEKPAT